MTTDDRGGRLLWHGMLLFFLGLVVGLVIPALGNPRMALSAHVGAVTAGTFVAVAGLAWGRVRLSAGLETAAFWCQIYGNYGTTAALVLAAVFGTSGVTPIAGAGQSPASAWQELAVNALLFPSSAALILGAGLLLRGLGARSAGRASD